ncbi:glycosomal membrane protein-like protein [Leishmania infantum JPCM5]|uniref:Glycosomal_membrane_protein-like_protein n=2 Tax=Leishmania infantum TaxID=5671 RepID=A0A6L0XTY5_LEIIN|nr:glycosomal membrane protein-like protein [Leishmania infantum JPCM5]CAC9504744.1 glycosomal_membrane_protein-like_protein [Leishmania infantum]CAM69463.1 glycosomal membrane protein-like protein [Leishmania infantum JPCM5]SUZ43405.1 glycosomal_membrane_protein-like_protein [Leishmania infantum]|eukprot:XP_001470268.1 glycosomal membrane protein-like protein [Leishmania infantum JPCM5]
MSRVALGASRILERTDSIDKLIKLMAGAFTFLSTTNSLRQEQYANSARHLTEVRSVLRLSRLFGLTFKMQSLVEVFAAQGFAWTERKKFLEFFKAICDFLYAAGDHALLVAREGLLGKDVNAAHLRKCTLAMQLFGHFLGTVFHLFELLDAARKLHYDPPAAKWACKVATISATREAVDTVVTLSICNCAGSVCRLSPRVSGTLRCFSGALSIYLSSQANT